VTQAPLANFGSVLNGKLVGPGGKIIARGSGAVAVWNETIGGWLHKLPTNRQNPYVKPGGLADIARGGVHSYDCCNIHNPLWVPPTGTGTIPCILQGAWQFDGKSAFYPRLQMASP
jgi:phospholipid/cholesterol/gamma-HCH transport system substrate-binding protein